MACYQVVRTCQAQCPPVQTDCGSEALHRNDIQKSVSLSIPRGGSIAFEHVDKNGLRGSISELPSGVSSYTQYNGHYELKQRDGARQYGVEITSAIKSLHATIKNSDGTVFWSGDLMKVGRAGEEKKEALQKHPAKQGPENSQKGEEPLLHSRELKLPPAKVSTESPEQPKAVQTESPPVRRGQSTVTSLSSSSNVQNDKSGLSVARQTRNTTGYEAYTGTVNKMSLAQAEEFMKDHPNVAVVLVVSTDWCGPCIRYKNDHLQPFAETQVNNKNIAFIRVNSDHSPEVLSKYGLSGVPNTMFKGIGDTGVRMVYENNSVYPYVAVGLQTREQIINQLHETQREYENRNRR